MSITANVCKNLEPLVSIGIPTFNRPQGLKHTLTCAIRQNYSNLEILVSDNGSDDIQKIREIIGDFAADFRVKFFRQKKNIGPVKNFEFLLRIAKGKYFVWMPDDDDYSDPEFISAGVVSMEQNEKASFVFGVVDYVDKTGSVFIRDMPPYGLTGLKLDRIARYLQYDITDHLMYGLIRRCMVTDFQFPRGVTTPEKFLILHLLIQGELAESEEMYHRNIYSFKTLDEIRSIGLPMDIISAISHHVLWYKTIFKNLSFSSSLYISFLYTALRLPKVSWLFRKILGLKIKQLNSRNVLKSPGNDGTYEI